MTNDQHQAASPVAATDLNAFLDDFEQKAALFVQACEQYLRGETSIADITRHLSEATADAEFVFSEQSHQMSMEQLQRYGQIQNQLDHQTLKVFEAEVSRNRQTILDAISNGDYFIVNMTYNAIKSSIYMICAKQKIKTQQEQMLAETQQELETAQTFIKVLKALEAVIRVEPPATPELPRVEKTLGIYKSYFGQVGPIPLKLASDQRVFGLFGELVAAIVAQRPAGWQAQLASCLDQLRPLAADAGQKARLSEWEAVLQSGSQAQSPPQAVPEAPPLATAAAPPVAQAPAPPVAQAPSAAPVQAPSEAPAQASPSSLSDLSMDSFMASLFADAATEPPSQASAAPALTQAPPVADTPAAPSAPLASAPPAAAPSAEPVSPPAPGRTASPAASGDGAGDLAAQLTRLERLLNIVDISQLDFRQLEKELEQLMERLGSAGGPQQNSGLAQRVFRLFEGYVDFLSNVNFRPDPQASVGHIETCCRTIGRLAQTAYEMQMLDAWKALRGSIGVIVPVPAAVPDPADAAAIQAMMMPFQSIEGLLGNPASIKLEFAKVKFTEIEQALAWYLASYGPSAHLQQRESLDQRVFALFGSYVDYLFAKPAHEQIRAMYRAHLATCCAHLEPLARDAELLVQLRGWQQIAAG